MMDSKAVLETSVNGEAIQMEYDIKSRRKRRSIDIGDSLKVTTPDSKFITSMYIITVQDPGLNWNMLCWCCGRMVVGFTTTNAMSAYHH
jgi:hypothetical protein